MKYRRVHARIPGSGRQGPTTDAVELRGCNVLNSTPRAVHLGLPFTSVTNAWVARSQLCDGADIHQGSQPGDEGTVRLPLYILKKWARG